MIKVDGRRRRVLDDPDAATKVLGTMWGLAFIAGLITEMVRTFT